MPYTSLENTSEIWCLSKKNLVFITLDEIEAKQLKLENKNTQKNEQKAARAFRNYLVEQGLENTDFYTFTQAELDHHLNTLWFNAKTLKK